MLNEMLLKANAVFQGLPPETQFWARMVFIVGALLLMSYMIYRELKDVLKPGIRQISPYDDYEEDELFYSYNPVTLKREGERNGR